MRVTMISEARTALSAFVMCSMGEYLELVVEPYNGHYFGEVRITSCHVTKTFPWPLCAEIEALARWSSAVDAIV